jgi:hypothetical protein
MDSAAAAWSETIFNIVYLIFIWALVIVMSRSLHMVAPKNRQSANLLRMAFLLLASGDTGHVGFRVVAHLLGDVNMVVNVFGFPMSLVGLGGLTTAVTLTFYYMVFVYLWKERFNEKFNWFTGLLLATGIIRLMMMCLPANMWGNVSAPEPFGIYRNIPLIIQGVGVISLIMRSAYRKNDRTFIWIGWMEILSYLFYLPVILYAQQIPLLGLLMIPKTLAYLAVAWIGYKGLWPQKKVTAKKA